MISTRDALRTALEMANRSGVFAGQDGVYGMVESALELMGEREAIEWFNQCAEWPTD